MTKHSAPLRAVEKHLGARRESPGTKSQRAEKRIHIVWLETFTFFRACIHLCVFWIHVSISSVLDTFASRAREAHGRNVSAHCALPTREPYALIPGL